MIRLARRHCPQPRPLATAALALLWLSCSTPALACPYCVQDNGPWRPLLLLALLPVGLLIAALFTALRARQRRR